MIFLFRDVPSSAALPVIRPALGKQHSMSDDAKVAMQQYLNHFLGNMDIVNSREVFLDLSFFFSMFVAPLIFLLVLIGIHIHVLFADSESFSSN